jgi:S-adenosylmethionine uptake transporter
MRGRILGFAARAAACPPLLLAVLGILSLTVMDAVMKAQMQQHPVVFSVFLRFACGGLIALAVLGFVRPAAPTPVEIRANLLRAPLVVLTAGSFFYSVSILPLAEAIGLSFMAPGFIALLGVLWLKERLDGAVIVALVAGLCGMLVMLWPQLGRGADAFGPDRLWGVAAALFSALSYAVNIILLRKLAVSQHPATIVAFQNAAPAALLLPAALWFWSWPDAGDLAQFMVAGALGVAGHLMLTSAFARANASVIAPTEYTSLVWAALIGALVFAEIPTLYTFAGAGLIVAGSLWLGRRRQAAQ